MQIPVIDVSGDHYDIDYQHAVAVRSLHERILATVELGVVRADSRGSSVVEHNLSALHATLMEHSPETLAQVDGLADRLAIPVADLFRWLNAGYLDPIAASDLDRRRVADGGCTAWASGSNNGSLLAKNRDQPPEYLPLQVVIRAQPEEGIH